MPPATKFHLDHTVVVLRRSPASVTSSSPSSRRRVDEALPQHSAGSEFEGRHRAERVQQRLSEDFESEEIDVTLKTWYSFEEYEA